jgi:predicted anti-sigma-YlaC factor YlaD
VRLHLAMCSMCRAYYDQLAKTRRFLRGRGLDAPDPHIEARLLASRPPPGANPP